MIEELLTYDEKLFVFLNGLGTSSWDGFWLTVTHKLTFIPLYAVLLFLIYKKLGLKSSLITLLVVAVMITCTDQLSNLFKYGFERPRPCRLPHLENTIRYIATRCGKYGFFSAHAASSMALAVFVGLLLKKHFKNLIFILLFWSVLVSFSRIYVGVHYPLDIIVGMFFGSIIGWVAYKTVVFLDQKFKGKNPSNDL
jgi:undecaprenyl-diphosphatase